VFFVGVAVGWGGSQAVFGVQVCVGFDLEAEACCTRHLVKGGALRGLGLMRELLMEFYR
jgi:hypothetical protein